MAPRPVTRGDRRGIRRWFLHSMAVSALSHHIPLMARLRGSWVLAGGDLVGPVVVVGFVCLWLALREWTPKAGSNRVYEGGKPDERRGPEDISE